MHDTITSMLEKYQCQSVEDYANALKEIIQEIALLGLWRAKFFEKAAFYGGTALRILYHLNRFSEDLDFSLLAPDANFDLKLYNVAVQKELEAFGFTSTVTSKIKMPTQIVSAFIKADTKIQLLNLHLPDKFVELLPKGQQLKIKMEVDTSPPPAFLTENKTLLQPIPFSVNTYCLEDCFAGKIHAMLYRQWKLRVKGRDWYDFVWFISKNIPVRLDHLTQRIIQSEKWEQNKKLTETDVKILLRERINNVDIQQATEDVRIFLKDPSSIDIWSHAFFLEIVERIRFI